MRTLTVATQTWPIAGTFAISRGAKTQAHIVMATLRENGVEGRGECVPYGRYGETVEGVAATLQSLGPGIAAGLDRDTLQKTLAPGAARNALDCALWDLEAKLSGIPVWQRIGLTAPKTLMTAFTLSLDTPEKMHAAAHAAANRPLLKIKLGGESDPECLTAIRAGAPDAELIVDANEGWTIGNLAAMTQACAAARVTLIEQPLPASQDEALRGFDSPVPLCADESCHGLDSLDRLQGLYSVLNIKLDKTGGLTGAIALAQAGRARGFRLMIGCMVSTSLAMAPAMLLAASADWVDLDGPLLLARDREPAITYEQSRMHPAPPALWG